MLPCDSASNARLEALYLSHHAWLRGWLWRRLGCPERAADFAHETFFRVLTRPGTETLEQPRAFLTCIATHLLIDDSRRARIERAWRETQAAVGQVAVPSTEQVVEFIDALERIARLLEGLGERPRKALLMYRLDGMSQADIAAELGVSVSMVKKYVAQGLVHCHRALCNAKHNSIAAL